MGRNSSDTYMMVDNFYLLNNKEVITQYQIHKFGTQTKSRSRVTIAGLEEKHLYGSQQHAFLSSLIDGIGKVWKIILFVALLF